MSGDQNHAVPLRVDSVVKRFGELTAVDRCFVGSSSRGVPGAAGAQWRGQIHVDSQHCRAGPPDSGSISVFGQPAGSAAARAELGWVPQELALYPLLTCRENLEAFGRYQGLHGKALRRRDRVVSGVGGACRPRRRAGEDALRRHAAAAEYGGRAGASPAALCCSTSPRWASIRNRATAFSRWWRNCAANGATIIYTTHYMEEAERLCDCHRHHRSWPRDRAGDARRSWWRRSFGRRSDVLMRFAATRVECGRLGRGARRQRADRMAAAHFAGGKAHRYRRAAGCGRAATAWK